MAVQAAVVFVLLAGASAFAQKPRLDIAVSRSVFSYPLLFAQQQGYFEQEGVEVVLHDCSSGLACMGRMLEGQTVLALAADLPIAVRAHERHDLAVLATLGTSRSDLKLIARKTVRLSSPAGLRTARVGVPWGTSAHYFADMVYTLRGVQHSARQLVNLAPLALAPALLQGRVDAVAIWEPYASQLLDALGDAAEVLDVEPVYTETFNLITLQQHVPPLRVGLEGLLRGLGRATLASRQNPHAFQAFVQQYLELDAGQSARLLAHFKFELSLTQGLLSTLEAQGKWARSRKLTTTHEAPNYLDAVAPTVLQAVNPAAVTLVK